MHELRVEVLERGTVPRLVGPEVGALGRRSLVPEEIDAPVDDNAASYDTAIASRSDPGVASFGRCVYDWGAA